MIRDQQVIIALSDIAAANDGLLRPEDIVTAAQKTTSALHNWFEWDDTRAAHQHRLMQARELLRVTVTYLDPVKKSGAARVFVSLRSDRHAKGGGYRTLTAVLSDSQMRQQLLDDALAELETFQTKYARLSELAGIFESMRKVQRRKKRVA